MRRAFLLSVADALLLERSGQPGHRRHCSRYAQLDWLSSDVERSDNAHGLQRGSGV
jgi:hypothetical protein